MALIALLVLALLIAVLLVLTRPREVVIFPPALVQIHQFVRAMVTERDVDLPHAPVSVCGITQGDLHDSAHLAVGSRRKHPPCNLCAVAAYGANVQFTWASFIASSLIFIGLEASCSAAMAAKGRAQTLPTVDSTLNALRVRGRSAEKCVSVARTELRTSPPPHPPPPPQPPWHELASIPAPGSASGPDRCARDKSRAHSC